jgi:lactoylglutathione lyase
LQLGLAIDDFDKTIQALKEQHVIFATEPAQTDFGFMAIIENPVNAKLNSTEIDF